MIELRFGLMKSATHVLFDGDEDTSTNYIAISKYYRNALYTPSSGDRVYFLCDSSSKQYILEGRVTK